MSQICLYLDEDAMKQALPEALRNSGIDAIAVSEVHRLADLDEEQLIWSAEQGRVIYSYNVGDFCRLHRKFMEQGRNNAGIAIANSATRLVKNCADC